MKKAILPLILLAAIGCGPKNEFDITPAQAAQAKKVHIGGPVDLEHLPPGATKSVKVYHKGDRLPDGTISDGERKMVTVQVKR